MKLAPVFGPVLPNSMKTLILAAMLLAVACSAPAEPIHPRSDSDVIERLPMAVSERADRELRRRWAAQPDDVASALALARREFERARADGDPRRAGLALAALQAWPDAAAAPDDVLLLQATVRQHLHEFDTAAAQLETLLQRRPDHAQGLLTLATIRRVQGRYDDSDHHCRALQRTQALYARACKAENLALRGDTSSARALLQRTLADPHLDRDTRAWLLTTLAETQDRAGRPAEAEAAYRQALQSADDDYAALSFADFLMLRGRPNDARGVLEHRPRTDAVLLRLAIAAARARQRDAAALGSVVRERMAQAALRPEARQAHAREAAMFALWVDQRPQEALEFARLNLEHQREPLDVLLLAQAARAARDDQALRDAHRLVNDMGLRDSRIDALL